MGARKTALESDRPVPPEHAARVPPAGTIHLAVASYNEAELEQAVEINAPRRSFYRRSGVHIWIINRVATL